MLAKTFRGRRAEGIDGSCFLKLRTILNLNIKPEASGKLVSPPTWKLKRGQVNQSAHGLMKCPFGPRREQLTFASCSDGNIPAHWTLNRKVLSSRCAGWK
ncbi:MAG: hypothetical protein ACTS6G_03570, partial [Candidatus Hodgkinia cicadicola]